MFHDALVTYIHIIGMGFESNLLSPRFVALSPGLVGLFLMKDRGTSVLTRLVVVLVETVAVAEVWHGRCVWCF